MDASQLRAELRKQPFHPFRLVLSNGRSYDVKSPELMIVMPMVTAVGITGQVGDGDVIHTIDNEHIADIEPLSSAQAQK